MKKLLINFPLWSRLGTGLIFLFFLYHNLFARDRFIVLNKTEADAIRGRYGSHSALDPVPLRDSTKFILPLAVINDKEFISIKTLLQSIRQEDIDTSQMKRNPDSGTRPNNPNR